MKNILSYNFDDDSKNGLYSVDNSTNTLLLYLTPLNTQLNNYTVEITDTQSNVIKSSVLSKNENGQIEYSIDESYFNGSGQMKIRLLSSEKNSDYIIFNCISFTTEDLLLKRNNSQYSFSIKLPASSYLYPPIGSQIYNSRKDFNPNEYYPGTKWERIMGNVLGGINEKDTDTDAHISFNQSSGTVIGSKYLQRHNHTVPVKATVNEASGYGLTAAGGFQNRVIVTSGSTQSGLIDCLNGGTGNAQNIQPTQLTYIWERVA